MLMANAAATACENRLGGGAAGMAASRIGSADGVAENEILRGLGLGGDERIDGLARAGAFDAAVKLGIMDRRGDGPVVHDRHANG